MSSADGGVGGSLTLTGGEGSSVDGTDGGNGGIVTISGGEAKGTHGGDVGGDLRLLGGSAANGRRCNLSLSAGASAQSTGGDLALTSGVGSATSSGKVAIATADSGELWCERRPDDELRSLRCGA